MPFTILSYNILVGGQDRFPTILSVIQNLNPDVAALIEAGADAIAFMSGKAQAMNCSTLPWNSRCVSIASGQ